MGSRKRTALAADLTPRFARGGDGPEGESPRHREHEVEGHSEPVGHHRPVLRRCVAVLGAVHVHDHERCGQQGRVAHGLGQHTGRLAGPQGDDHGLLQLRVLQFTILRAGGGVTHVIVPFRPGCGGLPSRRGEVALVLSWMLLLPAASRCR